MKSSIKKFVSLFLVLSLILSVTACSKGGSDKPADFPTKPITVINPYKAGGAGDLEVKSMQPGIEKIAGQSLVTEYLTTGGGSAAVEKVKDAAADGYTLLYLNNPAASTNQITSDVRYDLMNDFDYLVNVATEYRCIAATAQSGIKSVEDIVNKVKNGESISIAHSGVGSSGHLQILLVEQALGIDLNDVPFEGTAPSKAAFLGGHVDLWAIDVVTITPLVASGEAVVTAVNAPERHKALPDVPTFKELGYEGVEVSTSRGFVAPKGLPEEVKAKLIDILTQAIESEGMKSYVEKAGTSLNVVTGDDYYKFTEATHKAIEAVSHLFGE